jgi:Na+/H+ antiporter NhaA/predicted DsbA family dithiol-disulfide isomerase
MTFFFFVLGLEARREFDLGELRERRRLALPAVASISGMAVAAGIYLIFNQGLDSAHGWGVAMSTDTAFGLGILALVGPRLSDRLRALMLTVVLVDDVIALVVIATVYTEAVEVSSLVVATALFAVVVGVRFAGVHHGAVYFFLGVAIWVALLDSGVEPIVVGLAMGLLTYAYPAKRSELERVTHRVREFREQPTPELARSATEGLRAAISPNERLQHLYHPWTSYVIVPLFALANAGVVIDAESIDRALTSPITIGIFVGYVVGKPVGVIGASGLLTWLSRGRLRPPVGWGALGGLGVIEGIGFTVSLLIATLAFSGTNLQEAKLGIVAAALAAALLTWALFRIIESLPARLRVRALHGKADPLVDLYIEVDPIRDHIRGPLDAPVTVVEYADFECPYCGRAEPEVRKLLTEWGDVRYVFRHFPLSDVHPHAELAAEAAEAAAEEGRFWAMHDLMYENQDALRFDDLVAYAEHLELDLDRFRVRLRQRTGAIRVAEDVDGADLSGVSGTPTFFINGRRHYGAFDIASLSAAVYAAGARARYAG